MFVRRFTFTILTLLTFFFAVYTQRISQRDKHVSHETPAVPAVARVGASSDGMIALSQMPSTSTFIVEEKVSNRSRTLRAFFSENTDGDVGLYIESANPRAYYLVSGGFLVTREYSKLWWLDDTLYFYARTEDGFLVQASFNPTTLSVVFELADEEMFSPEESMEVIEIP
jgi:hypothetical protein